MYLHATFMYVIMLPRRVFRCLVKTSLNLPLVCIYGFNCFSPYLKIMKKFKENLACCLKNFWNIFNQDGLFGSNFIVNCWTVRWSQTLLPYWYPWETFSHFALNKKIFDQMKHKDIVTKIHFVGAVADIFHWFPVLFLEGELLIHILHSEGASLVFTIMGRFLKWE